MDHLKFLELIFILVYCNISHSLCASNFPFINKIACIQEGFGIVNYVPKCDL